MKHINSVAIAQPIERLITEVSLQHAKTDALALLGIISGGVVLSQRLSEALHKILNRHIPIGQVNIDFHRDDIGQTPITAPNPAIRKARATQSRRPQRSPLPEERTKAKMTPVGQPNRQ